MFFVCPLVINISTLAIDASNLFGSEAFNLLRQQRKDTFLPFIGYRVFHVHCTHCDILLMVRALSKQKQNHHKLCVVCYGDDLKVQIIRFPPDRVSNRKINISLMTFD